MKKKYQITARYAKDAFPILWNNIPDKVFSKISPEDYYYVLSYSVGSMELEEETVVYFKEVKRFSGKLEKIETDEIIYGV